VTWPHVEALRAKLNAAVRPGFEVTAKRTQFAMGEDSEAFNEINVSGGGDEFRLVVVHSYAGGSDVDDAREAPRDAFFLRVWLTYAREVWVVRDDGRIRRATPPRCARRATTTSSP
jgi:hypothetical protein